MCAGRWGQEENQVAIQSVGIYSKETLQQEILCHRTSSPVLGILISPCSLPEGWES